jgi:hypothetical protein
MIWASLAATRNHYLKSHTDEDFFIHCWQ